MVNCNGESIREAQESILCTVELPGSTDGVSNPIPTI